jgi:hypothetical protein
MIKGKAVLVGISSFVGGNCTIGIPNVFSRVSFQKNWILSNTDAANYQCMEVRVYGGTPCEYNSKFFCNILQYYLKKNLYKDKNYKIKADQISKLFILEKYPILNIRSSYTNPNTTRCRLE